MAAADLEFGTDGVRGQAGEGALATEQLERLGMALADHLCRGAAVPGPLVVGGDTRESREEITTSLARGLAHRGLRVLDLGVLPTAALALLGPEYGASCSVVISASHNPATDNGVKVFTAAGAKLGDEDARWIEERWRSLETPAGPPGPVQVERADDGAERYLRRIRAGFPSLDLSGLRVALDLAHGAAWEIAPRLFRGFGAGVITMGDEPDGRNINERCGSLHPEALVRLVREGGTDFGLAVDGDADRAILVDEAGSIVDGDDVLALMAAELASRDRLPGGVVVGTVMTNLGLERFLQAHGLELIRTPVGDRFISARLREGGFALGGEPSGHLIFGSDLDYLGDGLYTALRVAQVLAGRSLSEALPGFRRTPQVLVGVPVRERTPLEKISGFREKLADVEESLAGEGRVLVRYSGTELLVRVMVEGTEQDAVRHCADDLAAFLADRIGALDEHTT